MNKFAVSAFSFDNYSETFIRNHADNIFPGLTSLVAVDTDAVFPSTFEVEDCFKFSKSENIFPKKIESLYRLFSGGSVFYPGRKNCERLAAFLKKRGITTMLAEYGMVGCAVEEACRQAGVKLFVHFHGVDASLFVKQWHVRYAYRRLSEFAKGFIFPSNFLANKLCSSIGIERNDDIHIVPCCVSSEWFCATKNKNHKLILAVGRFVEKKAPQKSILAFSKILQKFPDMCLEMIGEGELLGVCKDLVKKLNIQDSVVFHGKKNHDFVKEKMAQANIFLQHSVTAPNGDTEGLGVSLLEAMASGAIVVATRHNGFVETVIDGVTGFLVDENDVDAMAEKCLILLKNEVLGTKMRERAIKRVETSFNVKKQMLTLRKIMGIDVFI